MGYEYQPKPGPNITKPTLPPPSPPPSLLSRLTGYGYQPSPGPNIYGQYPAGYQQPYYGSGGGSMSWW